MINDIIDKPISKFTGKVKNTYGFSGNAEITTTTITTMTTNSEYGLSDTKYRSESIMGVTHDARDNAIDVTYSTKPDREGVIVASINSIDTNEKESELISLDILGNIKIWDTTELINFQTLKINEEVEDKGTKKSHTENNTKKRN